MRMPELLAPAGDMEKLKVALHFGADAVYLGGQDFGLRANAGNFSLEELGEARRLTGMMKKKIYLTVNASLKPCEFGALENYLEELKPLDLDAYIVSDPGVLTAIRRIDPDRSIHLSTQANTCNGYAATFWWDSGVGRINLARELSLEDIRLFRSQTPAEMALEAFVHGAMCVAHSGRCLISSVMNNRSANRGDCSHSCRWQYHIVEEMRPGDVMPVEEDQRGTYLFNSRDLCLIDHLGPLVNAGIDSFKIEGRMKSVYYVAVVTRVYRAALDSLAANPEGWTADPSWREELETVSHRPYDTGFLLPRTDPAIHDADSHYVRQADFLGVIRRAEDGTLVADTRNRVLPGETLELVGPTMRTLSFSPDRFSNLQGERIESAHANMRVRMPLPAGAAPGDLLRRRKGG